MSTSKTAEAARAHAIDEALKARGARTLIELLADHATHRQLLDTLCATLEALWTVVKKRRQ